jgi:hypothetical protein
VLAVDTRNISDCTAFHPYPFFRLSEKSVRPRGLPLSKNPCVGMPAGDNLLLDGEVPTESFSRSQIWILLWTPSIALPNHFWCHFPRRLRMCHQYLMYPSRHHVANELHSEFRVPYRILEPVLTFTVDDRVFRYLALVHCPDVSETMWNFHGIRWPSCYPRTSGCLLRPPATLRATESLDSTRVVRDKTYCKRNLQLLQ